MRNALIAVVIVIAGISANLGLVGPASTLVRDLGERDGKGRFLGILGPEFSGSLGSLETALGESAFNDADKNRPIVSGSATSARAVEEFRARHRFDTAMRDDEGAYCFLREQFPLWKRVAVLSEDGTGYGTGFHVEEWLCAAAPLTQIRYHGRSPDCATLTKVCAKVRGNNVHSRGEGGCVPQAGIAGIACRSFEAAMV